MENKYNSIPIIGLIPYLKTFENVREENKSIRKKLNNVPLKDFLFIYNLFFAINKIYPIKIFSITSYSSNQGKSLINILLAKFFSLLNLKVLLIDGDIRRAHIHTRLNIKNKFGLCELLYNQNIPIKKAIHSVDNNFKVITAGVRRNHLDEKLFKKNNINLFNQRLRKLKNIDLIIYDLCPISKLDFYPELYKEIDLLLMLVLDGYLQDKEFKKSIRTIIKNNLSLPGLILNFKNHRRYQNQV